MEYKFDGKGGIIPAIAKITTEQHGIPEKTFVYSEKHLERQEAGLKQCNIEYSIERLAPPDIDFSGGRFFNQNDVENFIKIHDLQEENKMLGQAVTDAEITGMMLGQMYTDMELKLLEMEVNSNV